MMEGILCVSPLQNDFFRSMLWETSETSGVQTTTQARVIFEISGEQNVFNKRKVCYEEKSSWMSSSRAFYVRRRKLFALTHLITLLMSMLCRKLLNFSVSLVSMLPWGLSLVGGDSSRCKIDLNHSTWKQKSKEFSIWMALQFQLELSSAILCRNFSGELTTI